MELEEDSLKFNIPSSLACPDFGIYYEKANRTFIETVEKCIIDVVTKLLGHAPSNAEREKCNLSYDATMFSHLLHYDGFFVGSFKWSYPPLTDMPFDAYKITLQFMPSPYFSAQSSYF
jgi:hypothetical protein